ncbi:cold shock protein [Leptolyngbya sp. PCC 7375]|nr:cold shock protein [Leptolyngbya sp. PCC 7375]
MKPILTKGQLITWKEGRGFGFIKAHHGGKDVFLHISALPENSPHPKVGDTILYQRVITPKGKVRAAKASIAGIKPKSPKPSFPKQKKRGRIQTMIGVIMLSAMALIILEFRSSRSPGLITAITKPGCTIKGNISINTGKKIYHLPNMADYQTTVISPEQGEKWFCTEAEATEKGWSKASK